LRPDALQLAQRENVAPPHEGEEEDELHDLHEDEEGNEVLSVERHAPRLAQASPRTYSLN
jgi:hypothetical protein